jgi:hypothetical protein
MTGQKSLFSTVIVEDLPNDCIFLAGPPSLCALDTAELRKGPREPWLVVRAAISSSCGLTVLA